MNDAVTGRRLNAVLVGTGMVAKTHVGALGDLTDRINFKGVVARKLSRVQAYVDQVKANTDMEPRAYADIAEVAADPDVDFAIVITPPNARHEIISTLAKAGKHILLEKPIERDGAAAAEIVKICEDAGVTLGLVFQHRTREASKQLARLVASGDLGALRVARINVPWWRPQSYYNELGRGTYERDGGGVMISQAIHTMDLALSLTGQVSAVTAFAATSGYHIMESEDFVTAGLEFENGAIGSLMAGTACFPGGTESITLHFENGRAHLEKSVLVIDWIDGRTEEFGATTTGTGGGADPMAFTHAWHAGIIEDFVDALRDGRAPLVDGREAMKVHRWIDLLTLSAREGRRAEMNELGETV